MELLRRRNIICMDMGILTFGCAVRFNPWHVNFISGLGSCENQPLTVWLIVDLLSLLWVVKNRKWSHWKALVCGLQYSAGLLCFMAKPWALVIFCGLCSWKNIYGGHEQHSVLKYDCCITFAKIVHISKLRIYKPDERGVIIVSLLCTVCTLPWTISLTNQFCESWPSMVLCIPNDLGIIQDIQAAKQEFSKPW